MALLRLVGRNCGGPSSSHYRQDAERYLQSRVRRRSGRLIGQVSVRLGGLDARSDEEKKQAALGKFKALARALDEAIIDV